MEQVTQINPKALETAFAPIQADIDTRKVKVKDEFEAEKSEEK